MDSLIDDILSEVTEPIGVSSEYGIEVYFPPVQNHQFVSNYEDDEQSEEEQSTDQEPSTRELNEMAEEQDDFAEKLRNRS
jgi:hypothetical protein